MYLFVIDEKFGGWYIISYLCDVIKNKKGDVYVRYSELEKLFKKKGCYLYREGSNHSIWKDSEGKLMPIPRHNGQEVPPGTLKKIEKWAGI